MPKAKSTGAAKGFAFIEYENSSSTDMYEPFKVKWFMICSVPSTFGCCGLGTHYLSARLLNGCFGKEFSNGDKSLIQHTSILRRTHHSWGGRAFRTLNGVEHDELGSILVSFANPAKHFEAQPNSNQLQRQQAGNQKQNNNQNQNQKNDSATKSKPSDMRYCE
jgi:hypothetical protein